MLWLLENGTLDAISASHKLTDAQISGAMASIGDPRGSAERVMTIAGDTATINVVGVMTTAPSFMAYYFGGGNVLFGDIEEAARSAEADPAIKSIDFFFNSGGGEALPTVATGDIIAAMKKPTRAIVSVAASAAYWLASQADEVLAASRASHVGSIGVVNSRGKPSESAYAEITSTNAPNKRPDPETEEGRAVIREEIDPMHELFATAVAVGRNVTIEKVNADFGKGGMMLAAQAITAGMIDGMLEKIKTKTTKNQPKATGAKIMDLATLQAEHPAVFAAAKALGHTEGAAAELDRVKYHALMGQKTGATEFALDACLKGTDKGNTECQVEYMTFGRNKTDLSARGADEQELDGNAPAAVDEKARETAAVSNIFERIL